VPQVTCESGVKGWRDRLRNGYENLEEFESYCETYGLHTRLGFDTPAEAWEANPTVEGSVVPSDFRKVDTRCRAFGGDRSGEEGVCEFLRSDGTCSDSNIAKMHSCGEVDE